MDNFFDNTHLSIIKFCQPNNCVKAFLNYYKLTTMLTKKLEIGLIKAITQLQFARRYLKIIENLAWMSTGTRRGEHCVAGVHENLNALDDFAS